MKRLETARKAARKAIESIYYEGSCSIYEFRDVFDEETKITSSQVVPVYESIPCKLSFETLQTADQTETTAALRQGVKLFMAPEIRVNGGSKIVVTWCGEDREYSLSGEPAVYPSHQEIMLDIFRGWA